MKPKTYADTLQLLEDMRDYALKAKRFSAGKGLEELAANEQYRFSILYPLQVVGEAASRTPEAVRSLAPELPWNLIAGFRHVVVHGYDSVRADRVQSILDQELDPLLASLEVLIPLVETLGDGPLP